MRITTFFRWYDIWIGAYIDTAKKAVYICPIPMVGIKVEYGTPTPDQMKEEILVECNKSPNSCVTGCQEMINIRRIVGGNDA